MSTTIYDFTYTLNSETAQNEVLYNADAPADKDEYKPISSFFVDESKLSSTIATNEATDAFGPVIGSTTTKYRTTSKVRATNADPVKVFAICNGQVLIQPQTEDATKVNLILKPSDTYAPLKIKYFVYRGINKADIIESNKLKPVTTDVNQSGFLKKLWTQYLAYYSTVIDPITKLPVNPPTEFPASLIGYDEMQSDNTLIENYFTKNNITTSYQIPLCTPGEHLGNFTGEIGLDIVMDHGDYQLENQEELFKFDLKFAREKEHVFDITTIPASPPLDINRKRYREYIHQFLDAAAFWGSHIECGTINTINTTGGLKTNDDIFTKIVNKYQTQNKIYVYIQGENNRSYNYYDATRKVYGFLPGGVGQLNIKDNWPIIIEQLVVPVSTTPIYKQNISFNLEYKIDTRIPEPERHVSIDVVSANKNTTSAYPLIEKPLNPVAPATIPAFLCPKTSSITIEFQVNGASSCATFLMFYGNFKQEFPLKNYYNDLFPVNFNSNFLLPTTEIEDMSSWATYDKSRMVNLDDVLGVGASIQNKLVFDNGKGPVVGGIAARKARRLYMAILKRNTDHSTEYNGFNIHTNTSGINKITTTQEAYANNLYNDVDFSVYKGTFRDSGVINSLTLINEKSLEKRNSFFHLGITEEEYNKLVYGQTTIPAVTPPATIPQYLPIDADNVFFHLEEVIDFNKPNVQKFKVGFRFENALGDITTLFPATANEVYVYTIDGFYFFSREYSDFQEFTNTFAKAMVEFRTVPVAIPASGSNPAIPAYNGEFGFDWLRQGDNGEPSYESIIVGGYERPTVADTNTEYEYTGISSSNHGINDAIKALKREYKSIPTQATSPDEQYFIPYLNLFSKTYSDSLPATVSPKPPYEATLKVLVLIDEAVDKLEFDYDTNLFIIDKPILSDKSVTTLGKVQSIDKTIKVTCINDFSEAKQIRVLAYPVGVTDKKQAKLAGLIHLGKNDIKTNMKFVFIKVRTNVDGTGNKTGATITNEKLNLINSLAHFNITASVEDCPNILDLSSNPDYKIGGQFIHSNNKLWEDASNFFTNLKTLFFNETDSSRNYINSKYNTGYFTVFIFDTLPYDTAVGQVENLGIRNLILLPGRNDRTISHEGMHGLGLFHSHKDSSITSPNQKYVFPDGNTNPVNATDNYMSYTGAARKSTWKWQWKIINRNL
ncbi:hypothetical protein [Flavobacterium mesophilum]|uniref:hypothetical protein n=1 Tax=Flavobacterium mesophilum TaxID=3143495 RepID=UPI0031D58D8C